MAPVRGSTLNNPALVSVRTTYVTIALSELSASVALRKRRMELSGVSSGTETE